VVIVVRYSVLRFCEKITRKIEEGIRPGLLMVRSGGSAKYVTVELRCRRIKMRALAIDTEYSWVNYHNKAFVATTCDENLKTNLYDLSKKNDRLAFKKLAGNKFIRKVFHNAPADIDACLNAGIEIVGPYEDTMTQANIINENFETKSLKPLAKMYLHEPCDEEKELSKIKAKLKREAKKKGIIFSYEMIPAEILYPYAKKDPWYTMRLWQLFNKKIERFRDIYDLELSLIPIIVSMTQNGMMIDRKFVKKQIDELSAESESLLSEMQRAAQKSGAVFKKRKRYKTKPRLPEKWDKIIEKEDGCVAIKYLPFNPNSTKHVTNVLKKIGIDIPMVPKERDGEIIHGEFKTPTDMATLEKYVDNKFVASMLRYRFVSKQLSTYYMPLYYWYTGPDNDRAHFSLFQSGAKSGRFSAELVQTIPRREDDKGDKKRIVRNAFIPAPGYTWIAADYDQVEMRLFAHFSGNEIFIKNILDGLDPHLETAIEIWGKKVVLDSPASKKTYRKKAKGINFGVIYGMGVNLLAESLKLPTVEAQEALAKYNERYRIREYMDMEISRLYHDGYVSVLLESPRIKLYREYRVPEELSYKSVNIKVQGTSAYVMKVGMKRCWDYIQKNKLDIRMLLTIHDELVFEVNNKYDMKKIMRDLVNLMEDRVTFKVPLKVTPKISRVSWGEAKDFELKEAA